MNKSVPNIAVLVELGRTNLITLRYTNIIRYWLKLVQMNSMRIAKIAYELQYKWAEKNEMCLALQVKQLLLSYGFGHVCMVSQGVGNIDMFLHVFKQRCHDIYIQDWSSKMENMSRIQFLCQTKEKLEKWNHICFQLDQESIVYG